MAITDKEIKLLDKAFTDARLASRNAATAAKIIVDRIKKFPKDFQEGTPQGDAARAELTRLGNLAKEAATKEKEADMHAKLFADRPPEFADRPPETDPLNHN
jgi:hypothetical protein